MPVATMPFTTNSECACCGRPGFIRRRADKTLMELARCPHCGADRASRDAAADEQAEMDAAECVECSGPADHQREDMNWECHTCRELRLHEVAILPDGSDLVVTELGVALLELMESEPAA